MSTLGPHSARSQGPRVEGPGGRRATVRAGRAASGGGGGMAEAG